MHRITSIYTSAPSPVEMESIYSQRIMRSIERTPVAIRIVWREKESFVNPPSPTLQGFEQTLFLIANFKRNPWRVRRKFTIINAKDCLLSNIQPSLTRRTPFPHDQV